MPFIDPTKAPTDEEFSKYSTYLQEKVWANAFSDMAVVDGLYYQTVDIWEDYYARNPRVSRDRPSPHSGLAPALVDQAVAAHLPMEPQFHRNPNGGGKTHEDAASRVEKGLQAAYYASMLQVPNVPTVEGGKQIQMYNHTVLGTLLDEDSAVRPVKKEGQSSEAFEQEESTWAMRNMIWNPIILYVPSPAEVLMNPLETTPAVAIRRRTMKAYDITNETNTREKKRTSNRLAKYAKMFVGLFQPKDAEEDVDIEEWWSADWLAVRRKGGEILWSEPNALGIQPWSQVFGGNGTMPSNGPFDVRWWIRQSFLWKERDMIRMIEQSGASYHSLITRRAWTKIGTTGNPTEMAEQLQAGMPSGNPDDLWVVPTPDMPAQAFQHKQDLEQSFERTSYSPMVAGFRQPGVDTATMGVIMAENSQRTFKANSVQMEKLHTIGASNYMRILTRLNDDYGEGHGRIEAGDAVLDVKDIGRKYHIIARFIQVDSIVRAANVQEKMEMRAQGIVGDKAVLQAAGIEDVEGARVDAIETLARRDPEFLAQLTIDAYRKDGMNELADKKQAELDALRAQKMAPNAEMPPAQGMPTGGGPNGRQPV